MDKMTHDLRHDAIDVGRSVAAVMESYEGVDANASYADVYDKREEFYTAFTDGVADALFSMAHELVRIEWKIQETRNCPEGNPS
jgi:hypothetical protein